nr:unnamed protein product [Callosobruchus analis]
MRVRSEHWQVILEFGENNRELITGKYSTSQGKTKMNELWLKLANRLNSMGFGEKSIDSWRKKSKTKTKAVTLKRENEKTGGGPKMLPPLTDLENRLLALMGKTAISGDEEIPELGFGEVNISKMSVDPTIPHIDIATSNSHDHDYVQEVQKSATATRKRIKRLRPVQRGTTNQLVELSQQTLALLGEMNENMAKISESLQMIANMLKSNPK